MPCDSGPSYGGYDDEAERLKGRLDIVTRYACEMAALLTNRQFSVLSSGSQKWIKRHEAADRKRRAKEAAERKAETERNALIKSGLAKLTKKEREAMRLR
jgi:hypothetical protein